MKISKTKITIIVIILIIVLSIAFQKSKSYLAQMAMTKMRSAPVAVETAKVTTAESVNSAESAGRIEAKYSVDVVARINGWLQKRYFVEGAHVKKGQALFLIEPNEYQIAVQQAAAQTKQAEATYINAQKELSRAAELVKNDYVSKSYYDAAIAKRDESKANWDRMKATLSNARLNLSYTKVISPINGKIGKIYITEGNLVNMQSGKLATIVSTDPVYAYFTLKSNDYIKYKKMTSTPDLANVKVELLLADGSKYQDTGKIEFIDNQVDKTAGTIAIRASFSNPNNILVPGDFVTVVTSLINTKKYLVVPQIAVQKSIDGTYVYTIDDEGKAAVKNVEIGNQVDSNWEVISGLKENDTVIVSGITNLRPGASVSVIQPDGNITKEKE